MLSTLLKSKYIQYMQARLMSAGDRGAASSPTLTHYWLGAEEYTGNCPLCMTSCRHTVYGMLRGMSQLGICCPVVPIILLSRPKVGVMAMQHANAGSKVFACKSKTNSIEVDFLFEQ